MLSPDWLWPAAPAATQPSRRSRRSRGRGRNTASCHGITGIAALQLVYLNPCWFKIFTIFVVSLFLWSMLNFLCRNPVSMILFRYWFSIYANNFHTFTKSILTFVYFCIKKDHVMESFAKLQQMTCLTPCSSIELIKCTLLTLIFIIQTKWMFLYYNESQHALHHFLYWFNHKIKKPYPERSKMKQQYNGAKNTMECRKIYENGKDLR